MPAQSDAATSQYRLPESLPDPTYVYCWRGGKRSGSFVHILREIGYRGVVGLDGGYREWRAYCHKLLRSDDWLARFRFVVVGGLTGVGKSALLKRLQGCSPEAQVSIVNFFLVVLIDQ